ncbi:hypothetical protein [Acinetobacter variabilis]|uniref:Uncharacterized protein n=1 Tax=Acinetobacter variabilis TaxID=70346 RepID=N9NYC8_9GAMM|nr:hypothetical protein [Acinetobacter variabilis]ENX07682.1 hypothetical protein F897_02719 [Acinetobacter variabilis]UBI31639.1 hypothetical protein LA331_05660 [Acinetobacter variabilis]
MDLIEKYGSYDAAKAKQQELSKMAADPRLLFVGNIIKEIGEIEIGLLDYRRQHNIFEVGDKVVFKNVEKFKDNMLQVAHIELQKVLDIKSGLNGYTSFDELRHAEPEELEAGKRLEVNQ